MTNRFHLLIAAAALMMTNLGCSTPSVPYTDPDPPEVAWESYQTCIESLPPTGNESACDYVGTSSSQSANTYSTSGEYVNSNGQIMYDISSGRSPSSLDKDFAVNYRAYLTQVDDASLAQMTAEWRRLVEQSKIK